MEMRKVLFLVAISAAAIWVISWLLGFFVAASQGVFSIVAGILIFIGLIIILTGDVAVLLGWFYQNPPAKNEKEKLP